MKRVLITFVITAIVGFSGYYLFVNKLSFESLNKYSSETTFEVNPFGWKNNLDAPDDNRVLLTHQFVQTQFAIIQSKETIKRAIDDYDLEKLLGKNKQDLTEEITTSIEMSQKEGTDLMSLKVYADSEKEAQQISYALVQTFITRRRERIEKRVEVSRLVFADKRKIQEDKVEDHRVRLYALAKQFQKRGGKDRYSEILEGDTMLLLEDPTRLEKVRQDYERELTILDAIKQVEVEEFSHEGGRKSSVVVHEAGWSDAVTGDIRQIE